MHKITGKTFEHKDTIKALGGEWNGEAKHWEFPYASPETLKRLGQLIGCMVTEITEPPKSDSSDDLAETLRDTIRRHDETIAPRMPHREGATACYGANSQYLNYFKTKTRLHFSAFPACRPLSITLNGSKKIQDANKHGRKMIALGTVQLILHKQLELLATVGKRV